MNDGDEEDDDGNQESMVFFDLWSRQQPALAAKVFPAHLLTIVLTADAKLKN